MATFHPHALCDGWGWYVDIENMRPPANTMQVDVQRRKPNKSPSRRLKYHFNSLDTIKEEAEQEKELHVRPSIQTNKNMIKLCTGACVTAVVLSIILMLF